MKIAIYTSCAMNYYAKAATLVQSIAKHAPSASVYLCLCDELLDGIDPSSAGFADCWTPYDLGYDSSWIFKHNVMELCTAVKGRALVRLMEVANDADLFIYFDPDVYVYDDLNVIDQYLGRSSIGLVPHSLAPEETEIGVKMTELSILAHGTYNLGHLFVRNDDIGKSLARWWAKRLDEFCYDEKNQGLFTDQRWMDLVPALFEGVRIIREPNIDVASWNLYHRDITQSKTNDGTKFFVNSFPLLTYHFSGMGLTGTHRRVRDIFAPTSGGAAELERLYQEAIDGNCQEDLQGVPPAYDTFDNGVSIPWKARQLYRNEAHLQKVFPNPYRATGEETFYHWLARNRPGTMDGIVLNRHRIERAFEQLFDEDYYRDRYADADDAVKNGRFESGLQHHISVGSKLLYDPNEFFVTAYYIDEARTLSPIGDSRPIKESTILWHYLKVGLANGVEPIEFFDSAFYLSSNPALERAFRVGKISAPLAHFFTHGSKEGRRPSKEFHPKKYLADTPDAADLVEEEGVRGAFGAFVRLGGVVGREVV